MHEVINVSVSHRSNHLVTQFYNCQEELLQYSRVDQPENDPSIFLDPVVDLASKTISYTPRALLWDAKTGNGALGTYAYSETKDSYDENWKEDEGDDHSYEIVQTHHRIPKSAYQEALDKGIPTPKLNSQNTKYWSDYSKLIFPSSSFNILHNWYHDVNNPSLPDFQNLGQMKFDKFDIGVQEFRETHCDGFFDGNFHTQLERCDALQGFNLVTELDNAWGGFTSELLVELRDELPKIDVFTWGFNADDVLSRKQPIHSTKTKFQMLCNKIRSTLALSQESDLFFPLYARDDVSLWESTSEVCLLFESVNAVVSQTNTENRRTFNYLTNALTLGEKHRNIVSLMEVDSKKYSFYGKMPSYRNDSTPSHVFARATISRATAGDVPPSNSQIRSPPRALSEKNMTELKTYPWTPPDTTPKEFQDGISLVELGVTEKTRDVFKQWLDMVSKYLRYDSDREELKEQLGTLASQYEYGWYDDDESGDDL